MEERPGSTSERLIRARSESKYRTVFGIRSSVCRIPCLFLALLHLILVFLGATKTPVWKAGRPGEWLSRYMLYSGAGSTYSFFAPEIGYDYRTEFDVYDRAGNLLVSEPLYRSSNREGNLRVTNIVEHVSKNLSNPDTRQELTASLTAKVFARHLDGARIVMRVESLDVPTMAEYRDGVRYDWELIYRAQFSHKTRAQDG